MESRKSIIPLPSTNYSIRSVKPIVSRQSKPIVSRSQNNRLPVIKSSRSPERIHQLLPELQEEVLELIELEQLIEQFKTNKQLFRPLIYRALPKIIENYYLREKLPKKVSRKLFDYDLSQFANDLFDMKEDTLVKRILELADPEDNIYDSLINSALNNQERLEVYLKMAPENHDFGFFEEIFEDSIGEGRMSTKEYRKFVGSALRAAINAKNLYVLEYLISFWDLDRVFWTDQRETSTRLGPEEANMVREIDQLVQQAKTITENYNDLIQK